MADRLMRHPRLTFTIGARIEWGIEYMKMAGAWDA